MQERLAPQCATAPTPWLEVGVGLPLGLAAFGVLLFGAAPTVFWRDAGQLGAAAFSLGVPHPTGFPLYMMLGKLASLIPLGSVAFRMNLLSAGCGAAVVGLLGGAVARLGPREGGATGLGLLAGGVTAAVLLCNTTFWLHATTTEVYAPAALGLTAGLAIVASRPQTGSTRLELLLAASTGLAAGTHISAALGLAVLWAVLLVAEARARGGRRALALVGRATPVVVAGLLVYAYLPVATLHDPYRNWGDPSTPSRFLAHVTGSTIREAFSGRILSHSRLALAANLRGYCGQLVEGVGLVAPALALIGVAALAWRRRLALLFMLVGVWLVDAAFTVLVNPMGIADRQTGVPSALAMAALAGVGATSIALLLRRLPARWLPAWAPPALAATAIVAALAPALASVRELRLRTSDCFADLYGQSALRQAPPGAVLFSAQDDATGVLTYLLGVEGSRPDLALVPLAHIYDAHEITHWSRLYGPDVIPADVVEQARDAARTGELLEASTQETLLATIIRGLQGRRAMMWQLGEGDLDAIALPLLAPGFPLWHLRSKPGTPQPYPTDLVPSQVRRFEALAGIPPDPTAAGVMAETARQAGLVEARVGRLKVAVPLLEQAVALAPDNASALSNLSALLDRQGDLPRALALAQRAVEARPDYPLGRRNLASLLLRTGQKERAEEEARQALSITSRPRDKAKIHVILAQTAAARGDLAAARAEVDEALANAPNLAEAIALKADLARDGSER